MKDIQKKKQELERLPENAAREDTVLASSGGVDSALLLFLMERNRMPAVP